MNLQEEIAGEEILEQQETPTAIRVILADSQAIYRVGIRKVFGLEDDIRVVAQAETLENLYAALQNFPTDVVLLEGRLIAGTVDAIPQLLQRSPETKLIVQVMESDESNTVELYRRGVQGVVTRSVTPELLVRCVRKVANGETWIDNKSVSWVIDAYRAQAAVLTTPRSQPKLSDKEIAFQIGTSEQVIKNYLRKIYDKLGVSDRLELALYCLHHEILRSQAKAAEVPFHDPGVPLRAKM
jgi:DNA-binding NarL/FixJ family response regulator